MIIVGHYHVEAKIWNKNKALKYNNYPGNLKEGDIIEVNVDMIEEHYLLKLMELIMELLVMISL